LDKQAFPQVFADRCLILVYGQIRLSGPLEMAYTVPNWFVNEYVTISDLKIVPTVRVVAYPCFIMDCSTLAAEI